MPPRPPRAMLHVGSPKTGTTYIQDLVWGSREDLAGSGVTLPMRRRDHYRLAELMRGTPAPEVDRPGEGAVLEQLRSAVAEVDGDVLLSNELLALALPERIDDLLGVLDRFEVHVVLTVRDYERQVPSEWQQFVKTQHPATFGNFVGRIQDNPEHRFWGGQDYAAVLARWGRDLPAEHVHVVTVPPSGSPSTLLLDRVSGVLGLDPDLLDTTTPRRNVALGFEQTEVLRLVNKRLPAELLERRFRYSRLVKRWLAETVLAQQEGARIVIDHQHTAWCRSVAEQQIERIVAAGYDVVGDLEELLPTTPADQTAPRASQADLLEVALETLTQAVVQRSEDLDRIAELERQLAQRRNEESREPEREAPRRGLFGRAVTGRGVRVGTPPRR